MNLKDKLVDPRIMLILGAIFLLIGFVDTLFVTDASSIAEMTVWGKTSVIAFMVVLGWVATFMMIFPLVRKLFGKNDNSVAKKKPIKSNKG